MSRTLARWLAVWVGCLVLAWRCGAAEAEPLAGAGQLFSMGRPAEAAGLLDRWLATNAASADVLFNLGQARAQAGEPGKALAAWRRAARLSPRDRGIRLALEQARERRGGGGVHPLLAMTGWLRDEEWALLAVVSSVVLAGVLVVRQVRPGLGGGLLLGVALVQVACGVGWGLNQAGRGRSANAVVVGREVTVAQAPVAESRRVRPLPEGAEVRVLRRHGGWVEVELDGVRLGWVESMALAVD